MTKEQLIESAAKLIGPDQEAAEEYDLKRETMAAELNSILGKRADLEALIGPANQEMMEQNHRNHALFMASLFKSFKPEVLVETIIWVFSAYRSHGFGQTYWPAQLDTWLTILEDQLTPPSFVKIKPIYEWMLTNIPAFNQLCQERAKGPADPHSPASHLH